MDVYCKYCKKTLYEYIKIHRCTKKGILNTEKDKFLLPLKDEKSVQDLNNEK